jgi:hypothetical protein
VIGIFIFRLPLANPPALAQTRSWPAPESMPQSWNARSAAGQAVVYSLHINDAKRNIGYVLLDWESLRSLEQFIDSGNAREILMNWRVEEIFEVIKLKQIVDE